MATERCFGSGPDELKATAERWLSEFISSLGAIFPPEHTEGPKRMTGRQLVRTCSCGKPWPCEQARWNQLRKAIESERDASLTQADETGDCPHAWRPETSCGAARALDWALEKMEAGQ